MVATLTRVASSSTSATKQRTSCPSVPCLLQLTCEVHGYKAFIFKFQGKEDAGSKVANAVVTIQKMLPKARVVYCSATGVSDVKNMVSASTKHDDDDVYCVNTVL